MSLNKIDERCVREDMISDFDAVVETLNASPMFHMSLGSRELFHSNFIGWLLTAYPETISCLGVTLDEPFVVVREKKSVDLVLEKPSSKFPFCIIENKFKDVPKREQLIKYTASFPSAKRVVLSLIPASFEVSELNWVEILYRDFAQNLSAWLENNKTIPSRDRVFISSYCEMTLAIAEIVEAVSGARGDVEDNYWYGVSSKNLARLNRIRFLDTILKHFASKMIWDIESAVRQEFPGLIINPEGRQKKLLQSEGRIFCQVWSALFNKQPCVTIDLHRWINGHQFNLTVQIQGNQYRRLIDYDKFEIPEGSGLARKTFDVRALIDKSDSYQWMFDPSVESGEVAIPSWKHTGKSRFRTTMRVPFGTYAPKAVYQYVTVAWNGLRPEMLMRCILSDVDLGLRLLNDENYLQRFMVLGQ